MNSRTTAIVVVLVLIVAAAAAYFLMRPAAAPVAPTPTPGNAAATSTMANPASVSCVNAGGKLEITSDAAGAQTGYCHLQDGRVCEEWALFRDKTCTPPPAASTPAAPAGPTQKDTAALNERIYDSGVYITPLEVVGDSRCPLEVYCIQAGAVSLKAKIESGTHSEIVTFVTGSPVAFDNKHVTLANVTPAKHKDRTITPADYRFLFTVAYGMGEAP